MSESLPVTGTTTTLITSFGAALVAIGGFCVGIGRRLAHR